MEEEAKVVALCVLHERALNLATTHDGHCFSVGTFPQFPSPSPALPTPFNRKYVQVPPQNPSSVFCQSISHVSSGPPIFSEWS